MTGQLSAGDRIARVRRSFARQPAMATIGGQLSLVEPGHVDILVPYSVALSQQHGFLHAGIVATALDSACGYAALSLMAERTGVLTVEFKINLMAPAAGETFRFSGHVVRAGRTITVARGEAHATLVSREKLIAVMMATIMTVRDREDVRD